MSYLDRLPAKEQTIDEAYGLPENYLEVEVGDAQTHQDPPGNTANQFTDYQILVHTNIPSFKLKQSSVRRRYRDFEWLRDALEKEVPRVNLPPLPGKIFRNRFEPAVIEKRRAGLERFLQMYPQFVVEAKSLR